MCQVGVYVPDLDAIPGEDDDDGRGREFSSREDESEEEDSSAVGRELESIEDDGDDDDDERDVSTSAEETLSAFDPATEWHHPEPKPQKKGLRRRRRSSASALSSNLLSDSPHAPTSQTCNSILHPLAQMLDSASTKDRKLDRASVNVALPPGEMAVEAGRVRWVVRGVERGEGRERTG